MLIVFYTISGNTVIKARPHLSTFSARAVNVGSRGKHVRDHFNNMITVRVNFVPTNDLVSGHSRIA